MGPALNALRPPFRELDDANARAAAAGAGGARRSSATEIRPFARESRAVHRATSARAAKDLTKAAPDLSKSLLELNRFFNIGAYNPGGSEGLERVQRGTARRTSAPAARATSYWLAWVAQNTVSCSAPPTPQGPFRAHPWAASAAARSRTCSDRPVSRPRSST